MGIIRSEIKKGGGGNWFGIKEAGLISIRDESAKFDWADVYLVLEFQVEGSQYTRPCKITGSFERAADGTIEDGPLLKRITYMCDSLGWDGGIDATGVWMTEDEQKIDDIGAFLTDNFGNESPSNDFVIYVYKEQGKNGKAYTRVHHRFMTNTEHNKKDLTSYIKFVKDKGYLKEVDPDATVPTVIEGLEGLDIAAL